MKYILVYLAMYVHLHWYPDKSVQPFSTIPD